VIDPGEFTADFGPLDNIAAVVVTHVHADHWSASNLDRIFAANPDATLFTTKEVAEQTTHPRAAVATAGEQTTVGPFTLRFGGDMHATIHDSMAVPHNTTVFVNDVFYYPGDSYVLPDKPVTILALPANAPWMKVAESMDYVAAVKPARCIPTHNGLLSEQGDAVYGFWLSKACKDKGITFEPLQPGESIGL
jgi:L-ascorbate metabolism protein UlaG (beta-lactamase superfamily)